MVQAGSSCRKAIISVSWLLMDKDTKINSKRKCLTDGVTPFAKAWDHLGMLGSDEHNKKALADYAKRQVVPMDLSADN